MNGYDILWGISKGTFQIPNQISYPSIQRDDFYPVSKIKELSFTA